MQKCNNCSKQFEHKSIIKSIWLSWGYAPIQCENCNTKHYVNMTTRLIVGLSIGGPLLFNNRFIHFGYNILFGYILWLALVIYLIPFLARYHIKAETEE